MNNTSSVTYEPIYQNSMSFNTDNFLNEHNVSMKTVGNTTFINTSPNDTFIFRDIDQYIDYKRNHIDFDYNENDTSSISKSSDKMNSETRNIVNYVYVKEPAVYQYVYHNIVNDNNYKNNQRATIKYHCTQFKKKHGMYKHISKNMLTKLHLTDNIIKV